MKKMLLTGALIGTLATSTYAATSVQVDAAMRLANDDIIVQHSMTADYRLDEYVLRQEVVGTALKMDDTTLPGDYACKGYYTDLSDMSPNNWACRAFEMAADAHIVTRANTAARPEDLITRAEALAIVMADADFPEASASIEVDATANVWQAALLRSALQAGIIGDAQVFGVNELATRGQVFAWADAVVHPEHRFTYEDNVYVGGAIMYPEKNIIENAMNSADHTTLVAAIEAAGLVEVLSGPGPFTVFAPTNVAFAALPAGTVDNLLMTENHDQLVSILQYHVLVGIHTSADIRDDIIANGGAVSYTTLSGDILVATMSDGNIVLTDENGGTASISIEDVMQSNGVIHVTNAVLLPDM